MMTRRQETFGSYQEPDMFEQLKQREAAEREQEARRLQQVREGEKRLAVLEEIKRQLVGNAEGLEVEIVRDDKHGHHQIKVGGVERHGLSFSKFPERITVSVPSMEYDHRVGYRRVKHRDSQFPMRKGGAYNYEGMAGAVMQSVRFILAEARKRSNEMTNEAAAKALNVELFGGEYAGHVKPSQQAQGRVVLSIALTLTPEQTRELVAHLRALGHLQAKK